MFKKILYTVTCLTLLCPILSSCSIPAYAADVCDTEGNEELRQAFGCDNVDKDLPTTVIDIVKNIIVACGIIAVIFVIIGGIGYITSEGDAGKIKKAKDTILYAAIGLIICALAFVFVNWVIVSVLKQGGANENQQDTENPSEELTINYPHADALAFFEKKI